MKNPLDRAATGPAHKQAFTLLELLCVTAIIGILAALLLPTLSESAARTRRIQCLNNLRQVGLGFQMFAHDHNSAFPMSVPSTAGGSLEFVQSGYQMNSEFFFAFRHFLVLSNELLTPRLLACPSDNRLPAQKFANLKNDNLSYFIGVKAEYNQPGAILAGDRNITNRGPGHPSIVQSGPYQSLIWTRELHRFSGNILFADGHTESSRNRFDLSRTSSKQGTDLFLPSITPAVLTSLAPAPGRLQPASFPVAEAPIGKPVIASPSRDRPGHVQPGALQVNRATPSVGLIETTNPPKVRTGLLRSNVVTRPKPTQPTHTLETNSIPDQTEILWAVAHPFDSGLWPCYALWLFLWLLLFVRQSRRLAKRRRLTRRLP